MLRAVHWLIIAVYIAAPILAVGYAVAQARRGRAAPFGRLLLTVFAGTMIGTGVTVIYALVVRGRASLGQFALAIYFATALLIVLKSFDALLLVLLRRFLIPASRITRVDAAHPAEPSDPMSTQPPPRPVAGAGKLALLGLARGLVLIALGLPYVMASVMVYRPKVIPRDDPASKLGYDFTPVEFRSTDGVRIAGWWIPAQSTGSTSPRRSADQTDGGEFGAKTVLVCHGLAANKLNQLTMVRKLIPAGYNALTFDFRAHGQSGGQLSGFGDLERRDVLGAVRWLRSHHPEQSRRIVGVGASMGAAALIAAAADASAEGQAIEAIAVYGTYADLGALARDLANAHFLPPLNWLASRLCLPIASVHAGTNLAAFKPANYVHDLWPRPILVIHGGSDEIIPFEQGERLFDAASFPRERLWLPMKDHNAVIDDEGAADVVREFFESVRPMPVI